MLIVERHVNRIAKCRKLLLGSEVFNGVPLRQSERFGKLIGRENVQTSQRGLGSFGDDFAGGPLIFGQGSMGRCGFPQRDFVCV